MCVEGRDRGGCLCTCIDRSVLGGGEEEKVKDVKIGKRYTCGRK